MGKSVELFENEIKKIIKDRNKKVVAEIQASQLYI